METLFEDDSEMQSHRTAIEMREVTIEITCF